MAKTALDIDGARMMRTLHQTCNWGAAHRYGPGETETGMRRLALSDDDKRVRDWLAGQVAQLGCTLTVDRMGNMFAVRPGRKPGPPTMMGSHLDTQPTGGRYDGILGVMAALEGLRTLHEKSVETEYPIGLVNWTNEEGARFPLSLHGSAVWAGSLPLERAHELADVTDPECTTQAELERIGHAGTTECSYDAMPLAAHLELHIEQGPILEDAQKRIGIVQGGQGYRWYRVTVHGRDAHTGTTPWHARSDAMLCAAKIIVAASELAKKRGGLASTGIFDEVQPASINTMARQVSFTLDVRHLDDGQLATLESEIKGAAHEIARKHSERGCELDWRDDFQSPMVKFNEDVINCVRHAADARSPDAHLDIWSGAGHDSCPVSSRVPTCMVFIPCREGLSHNPLEYSTPEDCILGAQVLLDAALHFDKARTA